MKLGKPCTVLLATLVCLTMAHMAYAAPVINEPFAQNTGALSGQPGGTGLGAWSGGAGDVSSGTMTYGLLPASDGKFGGVNTLSTNWASIGTSLSGAGLLDHGQELWFSIILLPHSSANGYGFMGLSSATGNIAANFGSVPSGANVMGIWLQNGSDLQLVDAVNGSPVGGRDWAQANLSLASPTLVVGKYTWGANGAANDTLEIYLPGTDLVLPGSPVGATMTTVIDQSTFSHLGLMLQRPGAFADEIRFGASYNDVITDIPEPASLALIGLGGLMLVRRR